MPGKVPLTQISSDTKNSEFTLRKEKKKYVLSDNFSMAYTAGEQYCFKQGKSASIRAVTQINFCLAWKTCFHDVCISFCSNSNTFPMMTITVLFRKPVTWLILFVYLQYFSAEYSSELPGNNNKKKTFRTTGNQSVCLYDSMLNDPLLCVVCLHTSLSFWLANPANRCIFS